MEWMFMPLKRYADFSGRSRRMEFWMWQVFQIALYIVVVVLSVALGGGMMTMAGNDPGRILAAGGVMLIIFGLYFIYCLAVFIPSLAVAVRRLHDTNRSGWWVAAPILPYILLVIAGGIASGSPNSAVAAGILGLVATLALLGMVIVLIVFYFLDGTPGTNRFGPDPKGRGEAQIFA